MNDYLKNNNSSQSTNRTNKINPPFFDNIINNNLRKKSKIKNLLIKATQRYNLNILKFFFTKWKNQEKEKIITNNNYSNKEKAIVEINKNNYFYDSNNGNNDQKEKKIEICNNNNFFKEIKDIENGANHIQKKLVENNFPSYEVNNNSSINMNKENGSADFQKNKRDICDNQIIEDDFDIKINEEMIIHRKESSKVKSDIFDSNEINKSSENLKDKYNINVNISNNSPEKIKNQLKNSIAETNNEICNVSNSNTHRDSVNNGEIKIVTIKEDVPKEKQEIIEQNNNELNNIQDRKEKFKEEIRKNFNKNIIFDSLENISLNNNFISYKNKNKKVYLKKINTVNDISQTKKQILNHFMKDNSIIEKEKEKDVSKNKPQKKFFYKISSTNNIILKNESYNNKNNKDEVNDKSSFNNTNLSKIENIFIKGNKSNKNDENKIKTENNDKKKLQLFIIDKNNDINIKKSKIEKKEESLKEYNYIIGNNMLKNNLYERLIDSNMIHNFLNNAKNEPMFQKKYSQTKQGSNQDPHSKIHLNINNIINFSLNKTNNTNNTKIKTDENKNVNVNYTLFNNNFVYERKNHFYLKKALNVRKTNTININKNRSVSNKASRKNNLKLSELELIEPNIQKCPVSLRQKDNDIYRVRNKDIKKDNLFYIKNDYNLNSIKRPKKLPKSLSTELISEKILEKKNNKNGKYISSYTYLNNNKKNNKSNFISEDLMTFIDCIKTNQEKNKRKAYYQNEEKDVYTFKGIKYNQINTYRGKNKKENKNSSLIVDSFKRIYNYKLNNNNKNGKIESERNNNNNNSIGKNNRNKNVDYKRLNELYLDYKIKDIKRTKLKNEQDKDRGITFVPHINKMNNRKK